ncbi:MAG: O-antigen polysaccharide polymerase Wzy [Fimbriimonadaceae bacterium]
MSDSYGYLPILYALGMVFWLVMGWILAGKQLRRNFFDPIVLFCLSFAFFFFGSPAYALLTENHWHIVHYQQYPIEVPLECFFWFMAFGFVTIGTYRVLGGHRLFAKNRETLLNFQVWETLTPKALKILIIILLIPALFALGVQVKLILDNGIQGYLTHRTLLQAGGQIFIAPLNLFAGVLLIYFVNQLVRSQVSEEKVNGPLLISLMLTAIFAGAVQGSRSRTLLSVLLLILTLAILQGKKMSAKQVAMVLTPGILIVFAAAIVLQQVRFVLVKGQDLGQSVEADAFVGNAVESLREYENCWWLVYHQGEFETAKGLTFLAAVTTYVPRSIWLEKPYGGGPFIRNLIRPGTYNPNSGLPLTSYTTGLPAEGFMNFGHVGFLLAGVIYGFMLTGIAYALKFARSTIPFCIWIGLLYRGVDFQRSEFLGGVANTVFFCVPLLVAYYITKALSSTSMESGVGTLANEG